MKPGIILSLLIISASLMAYAGHDTDLPDTGYWAIEGTLIRHPFPDQRDSLSGQEILELQDENGLSIWFSRYFFKDVCMLRQCRMIRLYHKSFYPLIADAIKSKNHRLSEQALAYFKAEWVKDPLVQRSLASIIADVSPHIRNAIIWKLIEVNKTDPDVVAQLFELFENNAIGIGSLNLLFRLVQPEHLSDQRIASILNRLASSENPYIRNLTNNHFNSN